MRHLFAALSIVLIIPSYGYSWVIKETKRDPTFPGTITVSVDPLAMMTTNAIDVLFVIDNSGSMTTHQANLANHIDGLVAPLLAADLDVHAAVISTDMDGFATPFGGRFHNGFVTSATPNMAAVLANNIRLGVSGSGTEQLFAPVIAALSPPLTQNENAGFLREHAALAIIFVTDAEDQSPKTPDELVQFLMGLKGGDMQLLKMGALYIRSGTSDCARDNVEEPIRLETVLSTFNATTVGLCDVNLKDGIERLGRDIRPLIKGEPIREVKLPMAADFQSILVTFGGDTLVAGDIEQGWFYSPSTVTVSVGSKYDFTAKPRGTLLEIKYVPLDWK